MYTRQIFVFNFRDIQEFGQILWQCERNGQPAVIGEQDNKRTSRAQDNFNIVKNRFIINISFTFSLDYILQKKKKTHCLRSQNSFFGQISEWSLSFTTYYLEFDANYKKKKQHTFEPTDSAIHTKIVGEPSQSDLMVIQC